MLKLDTELNSVY